uniref:Uncharacterized protein n=1 Tax=Utricularia reniformis TaxID=192314 RepID=A0A1Y0AZU0_9LAMI|nr:hypothetical protein AEK19_MT0433 [Utricularia reniformis]ART30696.1 hypothetical protein AEK19_MT0433 [Utricularia reniformis]
MESAYIHSFSFSAVFYFGAGASVTSQSPPSMESGNRLILVELQRKLPPLVGHAASTESV